MRADPASPTGYVGLRIGKVAARRVTDPGMTYDGQYWHYIDKWLLALARAGRAGEAARIAKSCFPHFFDAVGGGVRWKLSADATAPPGLLRAIPSEDALSALVVLSLLEAHREAEAPSLADEVAQLRACLAEFRPRVTDDALGWGLEAIFDTYIEGRPRRRALAALAPRVLRASRLPSLPFRLYGAMIGARVAGEEVAQASVVDGLVEAALAHEAQAEEAGYEEHSSINRVMLAMCILAPGALGRQVGDPTVRM
eukprot:CAMPEP_0176227788 /NCGR_PEP_ID=MMETSP0121_2-20121125/22941_1 /TAXON_ID=160619 /ORGANISM="Kryptoperidinium foliaceum, Strain CCMP 1326" /LENGTH=253 /DNA_ID=CAMNT_0017567065 /DNA_START=14 /DNA_END=774 /DNA_ORIENTATION=-